MNGNRVRACFCLILTATSAAAAGADFSIESKVYDGGDLVATSTTLFAAGKVYDLLAELDEAIVCDLAAGRIVVVDSRRKLRTEVTATQAAEFCERLRERARSNGSDYLKFMAEPEFHEELDAETNELVLSSPWMDYRVRTTAPKDAEALRHYQEYVRLQSMVNTVLNPGAAPPFARWKLNEALARRQVVPEEVSMRRKSLVPGFGKSLRAEHHFSWRLGDPDRRRIAEVDAKLADYRAVPISEYLKPLVEKARR